MGRKGGRRDEELDTTHEGWTPIFIQNCMNKEKYEKIAEKESTTIFERIKVQSSIIQRYSKHFWPKGQYILKLRIFISLLLLITSKLLNIYSPFALKYAIDILSGKKGELYIPYLYIFLYGGGKILSDICFNSIDSIFLPVTQV
jgi:hypothetical protein